MVRKSGRAQELTRGVEMHSGEGREREREWQWAGGEGRRIGHGRGQVRRQAGEQASTTAGG